MHGGGDEEDALDGVGGEGSAGGGVEGCHCWGGRGGCMGVWWDGGCGLGSGLRWLVVKIIIRGSVRDLSISTAGLELVG